MILASIGSSVSDLKVHLVLTTKYRREVFTGEMLKRLHKVFLDLLFKWDCKLVEFNGEEERSYSPAVPVPSRRGTQQPGQ